MLYVVAGSELRAEDRLFPRIGEAVEIGAVVAADRHRMRVSPAVGAVPFSPHGGTVVSKSSNV